MKFFLGNDEAGLRYSPSPRSYGERVGVRGSIREHCNQLMDLYPLTRRYALTYEQALLVSTPASGAR
jgi:hypothetical protein